MPSIVLGRELTKVHEELVRGPISRGAFEAWGAPGRVRRRRSWCRIRQTKRSWSPPDASQLWSEFGYMTTNGGSTQTPGDHRVEPEVPDECWQRLRHGRGSQKVWSVDLSLCRSGSVRLGFQRVVPDPRARCMANSDRSRNRKPRAPRPRQHQPRPFPPRRRKPLVVCRAPPRRSDVLRGRRPVREGARGAAAPRLPATRSSCSNRCFGDIPKRRSCTSACGCT